MLSLAHDYVAWQNALLAAREAGHRDDWELVVPPLSSYPAAELKISDPNDICQTDVGKPMGVLGFALRSWELDSAGGASAARRRDRRRLTVPRPFDVRSVGCPHTVVLDAEVTDRLSSPTAWTRPDSYAAFAAAAEHAAAVFAGSSSSAVRTRLLARPLLLVSRGRVEFPRRTGPGGNLARPLPHPETSTSGATDHRLSRAVEPLRAAVVPALSDSGYRAASHAGRLLRAGDAAERCQPLDRDGRRSGVRALRARAKRHRLGRQFGHGGTLVFGLAQLLLADHDWRIGRRDWSALVFGFLAFLSSGFVPFTSVIVGVVVLVRRGWRPRRAADRSRWCGLCHLVARVGPDHVTDPFGRATRLGGGSRLRQDRPGRNFESIAGGRVAVAFSTHSCSLSGCRWHACGYPGRLAASHRYAARDARGRCRVSGRERIRSLVDRRDVGASSRYVYVVAALVLPALAVAAARLRHGRPACCGRRLVLAATIPTGSASSTRTRPGAAPTSKDRREPHAHLAHPQYITQVPRSTRPDLFWSNITAGWLLDALHRGDLPRPPGEATPTRGSFIPASLRSAGDRRTEPLVTNCGGGSETCSMSSLKKGDELGVEVGPWSKPRRWLVLLAVVHGATPRGRSPGRSAARHPPEHRPPAPSRSSTTSTFALAWPPETKRSYCADDQRSATTRKPSITSGSRWTWSEPDAIDRGVPYASC